MTTAGLIFSNIHDSEMQELTNIRTRTPAPSTELQTVP